LINDYELRQVPVPSRLAFIYMTILASETDNRIPEDLNYLSERFGFKVTKEVLTPLIERGCLLASAASKLLAHPARCSSLSLDSMNSPNSSSDLRACPVPNGVLVDFDVFWSVYPRKIGKAAAQQAWKKLNPDHSLNTLILARLSEQKASEQWTKDNGKFIPHAATWLNGKRWEDELAPTHDPMKAMVQAFVQRGK
jgi:hypothetical protein